MLSGEKNYIFHRKEKLLQCQLLPNILQPSSTIEIRQGHVGGHEGQQCI